MGDRKNTSTATSTTSGVLRPDELAKHVRLERMDCAQALAPWVENYWILQWELPAGRAYESSMLPHPDCTLSVERGHLREGVDEVDGLKGGVGGAVVVTGVLTRRFDVTLRHAGWVLGIKFRPGGLASFTGTSARPLRDVAAAAPTAFPTATIQALAKLGPHLSADECRFLADAALDNTLDAGDRAPAPDYATLLDIVSMMLSDRSLVRVAQAEDRCGIGTRRLQRLFDRYVGATPKWVLARYRIHDAVSDLDAGYDGSLADLANRYGWFDQAHFTREFTELVGVPPGAYRHR